jgi:hypothetical protein
MGTISLSLSADERDVGIRVTDSRQSRVKPTARGETILLPEGDSEGSADIKNLKPGETHQWRIDLARCFDLKPGRYTAKFWVETLAAPTTSVDFEVLPEE